MRLLSIILVLVLASSVFAETQQQLYMRAMQAEEAGNVSLSIELFEKAVDAGGEYTEEIREILAEYYKALNLSEGGSGEFSLRFLGNIGFYGLHYKEFSSAQDVSENGGDLFASVSGFLDYDCGNWIHSFGVAVVSDWFIANEDMPVLDTNDWTLAPGIEYSLIGRKLLLDVGVDFNITNEGDFAPSVFAWVEYDIYKAETQRLGVAAMAYYRNDGPASMALYGSWHRADTYGLNTSLYAGLKYEADYLVDILSYVDQFSEDCERDMWGNCLDQGMGQQKTFEDYWAQCVEEHGEDLCRDSQNGLLPSYMMADWGAAPEQEYEVSNYWSRWIGPSVRFKLSYLFKTKIELESKLNLFYAFLIDGASSEYEKMGKFSGSWGLMFSWNPNWLKLYIGFEQMYLHYVLPTTLKDFFPEYSLLSSLKAGIQVEF